MVVAGDSADGRSLGGGLGVQGECAIAPADRQEHQHPEWRLRGQGQQRAEVRERHRPTQSRTLRHRPLRQQADRDPALHSPGKQTPPSFHTLKLCFIIFRPHIMGEENHNLCCVFFLQILPNLHFCSLRFVNSSHHGAVGSAYA